MIKEYLSQIHSGEIISSIKEVKYTNFNYWTFFKFAVGSKQSAISIRLITGFHLRLWGLDKGKTLVAEVYNTKITKSILEGGL